MGRSFGSYGPGEIDALLRPRPSYLALDQARMNVAPSYRNLVTPRGAAEEMDARRLHLRRRHAYAANRFRDAFEARLEHRAGAAKTGDPEGRKFGRTCNLPPLF